MTLLTMSEKGLFDVRVIMIDRSTGVAFSTYVLENCPGFPSREAREIRLGDGVGTCDKTTLLGSEMRRARLSAPSSSDLNEKQRGPLGKRSGKIRAASATWTYPLLVRDP